MPDYDKKRELIGFYKKRRRNYEVVKMTIEGLAMYAGGNSFGMVADNRVFMMCKGIMEISLGCHADSKNNQQHKSNDFLYGCLLPQNEYHDINTIKPIIEAK